MSCAGRYLSALAVAAWASGLTPVHAEVWRPGGEGLWSGTFEGTQLDSAGWLGLGSFAGLNLALAASVEQGPTELRGSRSVSDGATSTEWRFNNDPAVLGERIDLDLGGDRGICQVRILPGDTVEKRPRFFLKGYRVEVSPSRTPDDWLLVAQLLENTHPTVDTSADSTWLVTDAQGRPQTVVGRFVRITVTREEPPNWVVVGEVEVYGEGFGGEGSYVSEVFEAGAPMNVGGARVYGATPAGTELEVQYRAVQDTSAWPSWDEVPRWRLVAAGGTGQGEALLAQQPAQPGQRGTVASGEPVELTDPEPARFAQYRVALRSDHALRTPRLDSVVVGYETRLPASRLTVRVTPRRPLLGRDTVFTCALQAQVEAGDVGFDLVRVGLPGWVEQVRVDGVPLAPIEYEWAWQGQSTVLRLAAGQAVERSAQVEVDLRAALLNASRVVQGAVARSGGSGGEGSFLVAVPDSFEAWTLLGRGFADGVLGDGAVRVVPNPFDPMRGEARIEMDIAKLEQARPVTVEVYQVSGRRVRSLWSGREVAAGRHLARWDGRDAGGRLVPPGLYLVQVRVQADVEAGWLGTIGVVY